MDKELIERLALAMFTYGGVCSDHDWGNANEVTRVHFRDCAAAALSAFNAEATCQGTADNERIEFLIDAISEIGLTINAAEDGRELDPLNAISKIVGETLGSAILEGKAS